MSEDVLRAVGGLCAPVNAPYPMRPGDLYYTTHRVQGLLRRWWFRRGGWSTEWKVEHVYVPFRIADILPSFSAPRIRARIELPEAGVIRSSVLTPRYDWAVYGKRRGRLGAAIRRRRERLALRLAPWLDEDRDW